MTHVLSKEELTVWLGSHSDIDAIKYIRERRNVGFKEAYDLLQRQKNIVQEDKS